MRGGDRREVGTEIRAVEWHAAWEAVADAARDAALLQPAAVTQLWRRIFAAHTARLRDAAATAAAATAAAAAAAAATSAALPSSTTVVTIGTEDAVGPRVALAAVVACHNVRGKQRGRCDKAQM